MPTRFARPTYPPVETDAPMIRLSQADLRRAGYPSSDETNTFVNSCCRTRPRSSITVPDAAGIGGWCRSSVRRRGLLGADEPIAQVQLRSARSRLVSECRLVFP